VEELSKKINVTLGPFIDGKPVDVGMLDGNITGIL
jgi:hypothetical protein